MKLMRLLIAALLAVSLIVPLSSIAAAQSTMFAAPTFTVGHTGFNQLSPSQVGKSPILFAPSNMELLHGGGIGAHFKPRLQTNSWTPSMKSSGVNQMIAMMSGALRSKSSHR